MQTLSQTNEVLLQLWDNYNPHGDQFLNEDKVIDWAKDVLQETDMMLTVESSLEDLDLHIRRYLEETGQIEGREEHLSLSYPEAVSFLVWLTGQDQADGGESRVDEESKQLGRKSRQSGSKRATPSLDKSKKEFDELRRQMEEEIRNNPTVSKRYKREETDRNLEGLNLDKMTKKLDRAVEDSKKVKTEVYNEAPLSNSRYKDREQQSVNDNLTNGPTESTPQTLTRKYKDYLKIIFEHYCKLSYAMGQDPTFQQIMHKANILTINKFMIFCKDFEISKISPIITRAFLTELFKKNAECYKEMTLEQFSEVLQKLANLAYTELKQSKDFKENKNQIVSQEMIKLLDFLGLSTAKQFKEKLKKLNIQYRIGPKGAADQKIPPQGYRFRFVSNNGKSEEQVRLQINERKLHRSERRLLLQEKINTSHNDGTQPLTRKKSQKKRNIINLPEQSYSPLQALQSISETNKVLSPPVPPIRKLTINVSKPTINGHQSIFKNMGYADLHKIKQTENYSKKKLGLHNNRSNDLKGSFKLNSIVEEARLEMRNDNPQQMRLPEYLAESAPTNSLDEVGKNRQFNLAKGNTKMQAQLFNDKIKRDLKIQQDLDQLIEIGDDQEDEFLKQHLEREKKNEAIGRRLSQRISEL